MLPSGLFEEIMIFFLESFTVKILFITMMECCGPNSPFTSLRGKSSTVGRTIWAYAAADHAHAGSISAAES